MMELISFIMLSWVNLANSNEGKQWSYSGKTGPSSWHKMGFASCNGQRQSPINLVNRLAVTSALDRIQFSNFDNIPAQMNVTNNNHTASISMAWKSVPAISSSGLPGIFEAINIHFHWGRTNIEGSEHLIDGESSPLEGHIVCKNVLYASVQEALQQADGLAVLGTMFEVTGNSSLALSLLEDSIRSIEQAGMSTGVKMPPKLSDFLPSDTDAFFRYRGSLTTPGCQEVVTWTVFQQSVSITQRQVDMFRKLQKGKDQLIDFNFRPRQLRNDRPVLLRQIEMRKTAATTAPAQSANGMLRPSTGGNARQHLSVTVRCSTVPGCFVNVWLFIIVLLIDWCAVN